MRWRFYGWHCFLDLFIVCFLTDFDVEHLLFWLKSLLLGQSPKFDEHVIVLVGVQCLFTYTWVLLLSTSGGCMLGFHSSRVSSFEAFYTPLMGQGQNWPWSIRQKRRLRDKFGRNRWLLVSIEEANLCHAHLGCLKILGIVILDRCVMLPTFINVCHLHCFIISRPVWIAFVDLMEVLNIRVDYNIRLSDGDIHLWRHLTIRVRLGSALGSHVRSWSGDFLKSLSFKNRTGSMY